MIGKCLGHVGMVVGQDSGNVSPGECGADRFTGLIDCGLVLVGLGVGGLLGGSGPGQGESNSEDE